MELSWKGSDSSKIACKGYSKKLEVYSSWYRNSVSGFCRKNKRSSMSRSLDMFLLRILLCMLLIHNEGQVVYGFTIISREISMEANLLGDHYSISRARRAAALIPKAKRQMGDKQEEEEFSDADETQNLSNPKKKGGVSKIVGKVGRLLENRKKDSNNEKDDFTQKSKEEGKEDGFFRKAIRGVTRSDGNNEPKQKDQKDDSTKTDDKNIMERFLRRKKKDPIDSLLLSIEEDNTSGEEYDLARLESTIHRIDEALALVRQTLAKYRQTTFTLEEARAVDDEIRRMTQIRRELEKRRKNLILLKTKLERETVTVQNESTKKSSNSNNSNNKNKLDLKSSNNDKMMKGKENNTTIGIMNGAQNLVSNVLDSMLKNNKQKEKDQWVILCPKTRISPGEVVPIVAGGLDFLIIASRDGEKVYCVANSCPHLGTPLETGMIERRPIEFKKSTSDKIRTGNALLATDRKDEKKKKPRADLDTVTLSTVTTATSNSDDGCEECIVCPLHRTAFALESGEVRGEWCPYPPLLGKVMGNVQRESNLPTFAMRIRGKNIEVKLNSSLDDE